MTPEAFVRVLEARLAAAEALIDPRGEKVPAEAFESARSMYLSTGPTARATAAPLLPEAQVLAPESVGMEETINSACLHLLTLLGFALTAPDRPANERPRPAAPPQTAMDTHSS